MTEQKYLRLNNESSTSFSSLEVEEGEGENASGFLCPPYAHTSGSSDEECDEEPRRSGQCSSPKYIFQRAFREKEAINQEEINEDKDQMTTNLEDEVDKKENAVLKARGRKEARCGVSEEDSSDIEGCSCRILHFKKEAGTLPYAVEFAKSQEEEEGNEEGKPQPNRKKENTMPSMLSKSEAGKATNIHPSTLGRNEECSSSSSSRSNNSNSNRNHRSRLSLEREQSNENSPRRMNPVNGFPSSSVPVIPISLAFAFRCVHYCISLLLLENCEPKTNLVSNFHSTHIPPVSIADYLRRLFVHPLCSSSALITGILLILRFTMNRFPVDLYCAHRLILAGASLGALIHDDEIKGAGYVSQLGGISSKELTGLQLEVCAKLNWHLYPYPEDYQEFLLLMEKLLEVPSKEDVETFCMTNAEEIEGFAVSRLEGIAGVEWFGRGYESYTRSIWCRSGHYSTSSTGRTLQQGGSKNLSTTTTTSTMLTTGMDGAARSSGMNQEKEVSCLEKPAPTDPHAHLNRSQCSGRESSSYSVKVKDGVRQGIPLSRSSHDSQYHTRCTSNGALPDTVPASSGETQELVEEWFPLNPSSTLSPVEQRDRIKAVMALHRWKTLFHPWMEAWKERSAAREASVDKLTQEDREAYRREDKEARRFSSPLFITPPSSSSAAIANTSSTRKDNNVLAETCAREGSTFGSVLHRHPTQSGASHRAALQRTTGSGLQHATHGVPYQADFPAALSHSRWSAIPCPIPQPSRSSDGHLSAGTLSQEEGTGVAPPHWGARMGSSIGDITALLGRRKTMTTTHNKAPPSFAPTGYSSNPSKASSPPSEFKTVDCTSVGGGHPYASRPFYADPTQNGVATASSMYTSMLNANGGVASGIIPTTSSSTVNATTTMMNNFPNTGLGSTHHSVGRVDRSMVPSTTSRSRSHSGKDSTGTFSLLEGIEDASVTSSSPPPEMRTLTYAAPYVCSSASTTSSSTANTKSLSQLSSFPSALAQQPGSDSRAAVSDSQKGRWAPPDNRPQGIDFKSLRAEDRWRSFQQVGQQRAYGRKRSKPKHFQDNYE